MRAASEVGCKSYGRRSRPYYQPQNIWRRQTQDKYADRPITHQLMITNSRLHGLE